MPIGSRLPARYARPAVVLMAVAVAWGDICPLPAAAQQAPRPAPGAGSTPAGAPTNATAAALERAVVSLAESAQRSVVSVSRAPLAEQARVSQLQAAQLAQLRARRAQLPAGPALAPMLNDPFAVLRAASAPTAATAGAGVVIDPADFGGGDARGEQATNDAAKRPASFYVLTQYLVVSANDQHYVTDQNGVRWQASIEGADPRSGLAVLMARPLGGPTGEQAAPQATVDEPPPPMPLGDAESIEKGSFVVAIGNPYAIEADGQATVSLGVVSNTARKAPADENLNNTPDAEGSYRTTLHHFGTLIQTDARLGFGAAGGALVTLHGELVGVLTTTATIAGHESPAGYAIPLNRAMRRVVAELAAGREPEYGLLGVRFDRAAAVGGESGRMGMGVEEAYAGGPAARAGLQPGDLILTIAGEPTPSADALQLAVGSLPPGHPAEVEFERDGRIQATTVSLGKAFVPGERVIRDKGPTWRGIRVDYATAIPPQVLDERSRAGAIDPEGCVAVVEVEPGSVSWQNGIRPYLFISEVSGRRVTTPAEFYRQVRDAPDTVRLKFTQPLAAPAGDGGPLQQGEPQAPR